MTEESKKVEGKNERPDGYEAEERITFKIYDMPRLLANELMIRAKATAGNKIWVVLQQLLEKQALYEMYETLAVQLSELATRVAELEGNPNRKEIATFGGKVKAKPPEEEEK